MDIDVHHPASSELFEVPSIEPASDSAVEARVLREVEWDLYTLVKSVKNFTAEGPTCFDQCFDSEES